MLHVGMDLSRHRLDVRVLDDDGVTVAELAVAPIGVELRRLAARFSLQGPVRAVIESMNGARFVHDTLEWAGWEVEIADAQKVKGLAPLACKTDRGLFPTSPASLRVFVACLRCASAGSYSLRSA